MRPRNLRFLSLLLVVAAGLGCRKELPPVGLTSVGGEGDPCTGRSRCLTVYLAPWCGACKLSLPLIANLRSELEPRGIGLRIVVGGDQPARLRAMANGIGGRVQLDERGDFGRAAGVRSFPSWWLTDEQNRVRGRFSGGARSTGSSSSDLAFLRQQLPELADALAAEKRAAPEPAAGGAIQRAPTARPLSVKPDPDCASARSSESCRECCARVATTGFVWIHGSGCRCPR